MKKIVVYDYIESRCRFYDSKDYIEIKKDNEYISDKYVSSSGDLIRNRPLYKGSIVIRELCIIYVKIKDAIITFENTKPWYVVYPKDYGTIESIKECLKNKRSFILSKKRKEIITNIFSKEIKIQHLK